MTPKCIVCKDKDATHDSPADLCRDHWHQWFNGKIEIGEDRQTWKQNSFVKFDKKED